VTHGIICIGQSPIFIFLAQGDGEVNIIMINAMIFIYGSTAKFVCARHCSLATAGYVGAGRVGVAKWVVPSHSLPMAIAEGRGVEAACQFSLGSRGEAGLRLDANHVVVVESVTDCLKVGI